ncbi:MAG: lipopolysaccharide biosynthesis protein [Promethearchaeota archaeon]
MENNEKKIYKISKDQRILAKNSFFSFLNSYSGFIFATITSFLTARMISQELWGIYIQILAYLAMFFLISGFLPPSLDSSLHYYLPQYRSLKQYNVLRLFIKHSIITRIFFLFINFLISNVIFLIMADVFRVDLENYYYLLFLLGPLILINSIDVFIANVNRSLNYFNIVYLILIIRNLLNIGILVYFFISWRNLTINQLVLINLSSALIPFLIHGIITYFIIKLRFKKTSEDGVSFKQNFVNFFKYGSYLSISSVLLGFYNNLRIISIGNFESSEMVLGYNIADHYRQVSSQAAVSLNQPLMISYSSLYSNNKFLQIKQISNVFLGYSIFLILLITGFLFYFADLYLFLIYGGSYLIFSPVLKLMLISIIFGVQGIFFSSLLAASGKVKQTVPITIVLILIYTSFFLVGLIFFGIIGFLVGTIISNIIGFIYSSIMNYKIFKIKLNIGKIVSLYSFFFIALAISWILEVIFLKNVNFLILQTLNLLLFEKFQLLSLISFFLIFITLVIIFKTISQDDIKIIEAFFEKDTFIQKTLRRGLNVLKKVLRN